MMYLEYLMPLILLQTIRSFVLYTKHREGIHFVTFCIKYRRNFIFSKSYKFYEYLASGFSYQIMKLNEFNNLDIQKHMKDNNFKKH